MCFFCGAGPVCCNVNKNPTTDPDKACNSNEAAFDIKAVVSTLGWWESPDDLWRNNDGAVLLVSPRNPSKSITPRLFPITSVFGQAVPSLRVQSLGFPGPDDRGLKAGKCTAPEVTGRELRRWSLDETLGDVRQQPFTVPAAQQSFMACSPVDGRAARNCIAYVGDLCGGHSGGPLINTGIKPQAVFGIATTYTDCVYANGQSLAIFTQIVTQAQDQGAWVSELIEACVRALAA